MKVVKVNFLGKEYEIQCDEQEVSKIINLSDFGYNVDIFPNQPSISKSDTDSIHSPSTHFPRVKVSLCG